MDKELLKILRSLYKYNCPRELSPKQRELLSKNLPKDWEQTLFPDKNRRVNRIIYRAR